ncbi:monocarboxylate transporter 12-like [Saccostrea cucullata]|uniref:monocarboxylate transporter 12-like n=1 Tax=Saccostrea cuccullata TaxID=36930 RepID=UPI002ED073F9
MEGGDDATDCNSSESEKADDTALDGGWGWMVVFGAFMINVITDGCSYSFGVLFTHLLEYFHADRSSTAWVGSVFNAAPLLFGPVASIIAKRFGFRKATIAGALIAASGMIMSVFVNSLGALGLTYGCVAGFGISLPYLASSVVVMMYFKKRRSLATGLAECGAGVGTLIFAPLLQFLISEYGWRGALLVMSAIVSHVVLCGALFRPIPNCSKREQCISVYSQHNKENSISEQLSVIQLDTENKSVCESVVETNHLRIASQSTENLNIGKRHITAECNSLLSGSMPSLTKVARIDFSDSKQTFHDQSESKCKQRIYRIVDLTVLHEWRFVIFLISNFILYLWYDVPYVFTVDRALEIGESESRGALIVSSTGIIHTVGNIVFGFLGDLKKVNRSILYCVSMWMTGLGLALVPLSQDYLSFIAFDGIYGFFVAASEALSCVLVADVLGISKLSDGYGILMFLQGIANLVGPPFAGWLYDTSGSYDNTFLAAGGSIIFLGMLYATVPVYAKIRNNLLNAK